MKPALMFCAALPLCAGCASLAHNVPTGSNIGWQVPLGNGTVSSFAEFERGGTPRAMGLIWSAAAFDGLQEGSDMHRCHGRDPQGRVHAGTKCMQMVEHVLALPDALAGRADVPFKWVLLNWNPRGHIPLGVYDVPHFDVHFMMAPIAAVFAIEPGPCGPELVRCDQFEIAKKPLPPNYMHGDFRNVDAVVPAMGNHLIDLTGPEFNRQPFTHSFIYGVYDANVIFYEQMVTRAYLTGKPDGCTPIKAPRAFAVGGYYPTRSCYRHDSRTGEVRTSLEGFAYRPATAPEPLAAAN